MAIICISFVQWYWLKNAYNHSTRAFEDKVHIALRNVAEEISELQKVQLPSYDLINQISQDYYIVNIRDAIDASSLEYYLQKEIETVGLNTDFEYGIYDCDTDKMVYGNYISSTQEAQMLTSDELPAADGYVYYFGVRFPDRRGYILRNEWFPILFTGILFLAVIFFVYATFEIRKQKKLSELQRDFINNMTHEFKTPLSSIKVSSEVFLTDPNVAKYPRLLRYAGIINQQSSRLSEQVERVLRIAGREKAKMQLQIEKVNLFSLVTDIMEQMKSRTEKENAVLRVIPNQGTFIVEADRHHLSNILYNLIDNALKYKKERADVTISLEKRNDEQIIRIADKGIGIDAKYSQRLKQKFFRVPTGDVHNTKGFGLGLYYVSQVIKAHQWKMDLRSKLDVGTEVSIHIPR